MHRCYIFLLSTANQWLFPPLCGYARGVVLHKVPTPPSLGALFRMFITIKPGRKKRFRGNPQLAETKMVGTVVEAALSALIHSPQTSSAWPWHLHYVNIMRGESWTRPGQTSNITVVRGRKMLPARSGCRLLLFLLQNHQKWRCGTRLVRGAK